MNISEIVYKMVLGTVQLGTDYGIANVSGKIKRKNAFEVLEYAWDHGIRSFDTAPVYNSESLLGEFIKVNGIKNEVEVLTKIHPIENVVDYKQRILADVEKSLENLGSSIKVLFLHSPQDSYFFKQDPDFFETIIHDYHVGNLGVSVYDEDEVNALDPLGLDLAFQFPYNILDQRFDKVDMPKGLRYARSVLLQGVLASKSSLRTGAPAELIDLQQYYHAKVSEEHLDPVSVALSAVNQAEVVDRFLVGVDSVKQLQSLLGKTQYEQDHRELFVKLVEQYKAWLDPREWS